MIRQKDICRTVHWGRPVTRIDSSEHDDWEAQFFDEVQAEVDAGFPQELDHLRPLKIPRRLTVANTRSMSPFYDLQEKTG